MAEYYHALQVRPRMISLSGLMACREAFSVLKEAGFSDEALCYEM
jgi:hypothetical protein